MATTTKGRVNMPTGVKEGCELAASIYKKHQEDGPESELRHLDDTDWDEVGPTIAAAQAHHTEAERLKGLMEEAYRQRDLAYAPIKEANTATSLYLKGKYAKNPKKMAPWGFDVDDTPPAKSAAKAKAK